MKIVLIEVRRKPLKETKRVNSITEERTGEYVQLNQYKMKGHIGQGSYGIVKLAYDRDNDCHYVSVLTIVQVDSDIGWVYSVTHQLVG